MSKEPLEMFHKELMGGPTGTIAPFPSNSWMFNIRNLKLFNVDDVSLVIALDVFATTSSSSERKKWRKGMMTNP